LQQLVFLAGILALQERAYERGAGRLVEARQLGYDDPRLTALLPLALVQAGQQLLFGDASPRDGKSLEPSDNGQAFPTSAEIYRYRPVTSESSKS